MFLSRGGSLSALRRVAVSLFAIGLVVSCAAADPDQDLYDMLGIGEPKDEATEREIKKQFRTLSRKFHPDINPSEEAKLRYADIQRANEVLSDRKKRKIYDMMGDEGLEQLDKADRAGNQGGGGLAGLFGFGGGSNAHKGQDVEMKLTVPLAHVYNGNHHSLRVTKQKICRHCRGTGAADRKDVTQCSTCKGRGIVRQRVQIMPGFVQESEGRCPKCKGKGKMYKRKCPHCKGKMVMRGDHSLEVEIERGIPEGHKVRYDMEADQHPDKIPGDIIFALHTEKDDTFTRRGNDLEATITVSLKEALLGFRKPLRHMDGHSVMVDLPRVERHGQRVRISGEGMPVFNTPSEKGDLTVIVKVQLPNRLSDAQREGLRDVLSGN